ncbi:MAG TPA: hypothetical protein VMV49_13435 [Candidatus Deferrimicrobium sp.]|nr:hypothetical protein [Candidatus Deferrimicrobium sp.]
MGEEDFALWFLEAKNDFEVGKILFKEKNTMHLVFIMFKRQRKQ